MMKTRAAPIVACLAIAGCTWQSEAMKVGADTYQTSANVSPVHGGQTGARHAALNRANAKCDELGKQIEVIRVETQWAFPANTVATVTFRCL